MDGPQRPCNSAVWESVSPPLGLGVGDGVDLEGAKTFHQCCWCGDRRRKRHYCPTPSPTAAPGARQQCRHARQCRCCPPNVPLSCWRGFAAAPHRGGATSKAVPISFSGVLGGLFVSSTNCRGVAAMARTWGREDAGCPEERDRCCFVGKDAEARSRTTAA